MNPVAYLETSVLYCDDNLRRLSEFPAECIDLIYLDPPFFSNRNYEVIWGDEAEVRSFEDRWEGGIEHYIGWMKERMLEMHRILRPTGVIFLHCDHHASHYLKVMMDDIFTPRRFQNELVWCYRGGGVPKTAWSRKHDTIFFYSKGDEWHFERQYVEYSESTRQVTSRTGRRVNQTEIDLERGAHMPDWWTDINSLQTWDRERLGYPTQKPEALLERILTSCSREGDVVLDPFCGCGTAVVVAEKMRRQWIGIDISPTAVNIMHQRLIKATGGAVSVKTVGLPVTEIELRELKPFEFQNWVVQRFNGTHSERRSGDMGIDGWSFMTHDPIQVKQSDRVGATSWTTSKRRLSVRARGRVTSSASALRAGQLRKLLGHAGQRDSTSSSSRSVTSSKTRASCAGRTSTRFSRASVRARSWTSRSPQRGRRRRGRPSISSSRATTSPRATWGKPCLILR